MRCLGYQQISRRLGREGCSTIRKCQLAASSFCRSLNPIFLTCISATGTGPLHSDKPPGEPQREHCYGDPTAPSVPVPPDPRVPQTPECPRQSWHGPIAPVLPALPPGARGAGGSREGPVQGRAHSRTTEGTPWGTSVCTRVSGRTAKADEKVTPRDTAGHTVMCRGDRCKGPEHHFCVYGRGMGGMPYGVGCVRPAQQGWEAAGGPCGVHALGHGVTLQAQDTDSAAFTVCGAARCKTQQRG